MTRVAVNGAAGRMGGRILSLADASKAFAIAGAFESAGSPAQGKTLGALHGLSRHGALTVAPLERAALARTDALIDFSSPEGALAALDACVSAKVPVVIGTTGIGKAARAKIRRASARIPVLLSANMSVGVNVLFELVRQATAVLGKRYAFDIEITEAHHRLKKDAPSGTAQKLAEVVAGQMGWDLERVSRYGRKGITGTRKPNELGIHVIRSGEIVGDHSVSYGGAGEVVELSHRALSRDVFARGALAAARYLAGKPQGLYTMADALGLGRKRS